MNEMTTIDRTQREYSDAVKQALQRKPQLYINGEFIGGSDIVMEMYERGELQEMLGAKA